MRSFWLLTSLFVATVMTVSAQAQPVRRSNAAVVAPAYNPAADPAIVFGETLYQETMDQVFGFYIPSISGLYLDEPLIKGETGTYTGVSELGIMFELDVAFSAFASTPQYPNVRFASWEGILSGPIGDSYPVVGLYAHVEGHAPVIWPIVRNANIDAAYDVHETLMGVGQRRWLCELDQGSQLIADLNIINENKCFNNAMSREITLGYTCVAVTAVGCFTTGGGGCIVGWLCGVGLALDVYRFANDFSTNSSSAMQCLCAETTYRSQLTDPSTYPPGTSGCAFFNCPDMPSILRF